MSGDLKWDLRFLELARHVSAWSKDPSVSVGAVIADPKHRVVSVGYNGLARGMDDSPEVLNNREEKLLHVVHAEVNALLFARDIPEGSTLYVYPFMPCCQCASMVMQTNIGRIVTTDDEPERWAMNFRKARNKLLKTGLEVVTYRKERFTYG